MIKSKGQSVLRGKKITAAAAVATARDDVKINTQSFTYFNITVLFLFKKTLKVKIGIYEKELLIRDLKRERINCNNASSQCKYLQLLLNNFVK